MKDRGTAGGDQPRGGEIRSRPGMDPIRDTREGDPRGRARGTPSVPPQPGRREIWIRGRGDQDRPLAPVRVQPTGAQMQETPPNLPSDESPLRINVKDDRAPFKLFAALKPLTGNILPTSEWMQWCKRLEMWTTGLSKWAFERSKTDSPQTAWPGRGGRVRKEGDHNGWMEGKSDLKEAVEGIEPSLGWQTSRGTITPHQRKAWMPSGTPLHP